MIGKFDVLVVDDNPDKGELLMVALAREGYDVRLAMNGQEALAAIESFPPDLVVTDVMMPEMNGYELARQIRSNPLTRFIPIILQSGARIEAKDFRLGAEAGALGFITDPADLDLLLSRARTLLDFKAYLDTCEEAAFTDHLTGLANRRRFERQLAREIERTARYERPFCLLLIDIDDFKKVNDTFGHEAGDDAIRHLAKTLQEGIRGVDLAARIGGDEFAVILPETDAVRGFEIGDRLRRAIQEIGINTADSATTGITASFGLVESSPGNQTTSELLASADAALYQAKHQGRDRVIQGARVKVNSALIANVK
jgi:diguanylate cyclase (GGDEF)-like protein